jgi:hypothetical protein
MFCLPVPTLIYLPEIYIFPGSACLFCCCRDVCGSIIGIYIYIANRHMNVEIGTEAAQFPEKKYINGIFLAVKQSTKYLENSKPSMYRLLEKP